MPAFSLCESESSKSPFWDDSLLDSSRAGVGELRALVLDSFGGLWVSGEIYFF